jgi:dUTPase
MAANCDSCSSESMKETYYTLELFPTSEESRKMYDELLGNAASEQSGSLFWLPKGNAGVDLAAAASGKVNSESPVLMDLGVKARMTKHWFSCRYGSPVECSAPCSFWLAPRSSIWKYGFHMANSIGVIDQSYRGVLMAPILGDYLPDSPFQSGQRYFQIVAPDMGWIRTVELKDMAELDTTDRGEGGFGSTGR